MLFKRKIYTDFVAWKNETKGTKALLIEGARRVGKSTICQEFAKNEYKTHILINFSEESPQIAEYFDKYLHDLDTLFLFLSAYYGVALHERDTLFVFDEVQACPRAREAIKFLVADGRYDYIETGSLISIRENVKDIVLPSEERKITMYPMDFSEFAIALNEEMLLQYIKKCFAEKQPLENTLHEKAMLLFKQYLLVGGMPEVVHYFVTEHKSFLNADKEKRDILQLYRNDIMKIDRQYRSKVLSIYDQIPGLLSQHEKRVIFHNIQKNSYALQYKDTFFWLANSMIVNECFRCNDPDVGLSLHEDRSFVKCYMNDTGLLVSHAFDENELLEEEVYKQILNDKLSMNQGMLYENVIAQMLVAGGHKLYFYTHYDKTKKRNDMEIDFLLSNNSKMNYKICPIEVKSGKKYQIRSLKRFLERYKKRISDAYIIHPRNLSFKEDILCIPAYMTFCL